MIDVPLDEALSIAYGALASRQSSPLEALAVAVGVVERADVSDEARIVGYWAMGAAERELSRLADAETHMRDAIALAFGIDDELLAAQVTSALVLVLGASRSSRQHLRGGGREHVHFDGASATHITPAEWQSALRASGIRLPMS